MVVLNSKDRTIGWEIKKKLGSHNTYGYCGFGEYLYGHGYKVHGIYQVRHRYGRIVPIIMKFYKPLGPPGPGQVIMRAKLAAAMAEWAGLTAEQKLPYIIRAKKLKMHGCNVYVRDYNLSH